jgi:hypothetical protein
MFLSNDGKKYFLDYIGDQESVPDHYMKIIKFLNNPKKNKFKFKKYPHPNKIIKDVCGGMNMITRFSFYDFLYAKGILKSNLFMEIDDLRFNEAVEPLDIFNAYVEFIVSVYGNLDSKQTSLLLDNIFIINPFHTLFHLKMLKETKI